VACRNWCSGHDVGVSVCKEYQFAGFGLDPCDLISQRVLQKLFS
jgi:hypothetical protein